jgi:hypothetical protein
VAYRHELLNLTARPVARIARRLWFEHTNGPLLISAVDEGDRHITIQRVHDTAHFAEFACQLSPAIQPGDSTLIEFICTGGRFVSDHYWRQALPRYTQRLTIDVRHRAAGRLVSCSALEEHPDGSETSATDRLTWDHSGPDVIMRVGLDDLLPNQALTLRWNTARESA